MLSKFEKWQVETATNINETLLGEVAFQQQLQRPKVVFACIAVTSIRRKRNFEKGRVKPTWDEG